MSRVANNPRAKSNAMTQLILHIGDPKTGTSSIQSAMRDKLVKCDSLSIASWRQPNATQLARTFTKKAVAKNRDLYFSEVNEWLHECEADKAIISSENFYDADPDILYQTLLKNCPDHVTEMRVVAYVRPHLSRALAAFSQRVKMGGNTNGFEMFRARVLQGQALDLNYTSRFSCWRNRFGSLFTLRPYIRDELHGQDVVQDFFTLVLDNAPFTLAKPSQANTGMSVRGLSGLLLVQRFMKRAGLKIILRGVVGGTIANRFYSRGAVSGEQPRLDRTTAEALADLCKDDARMLDQTFFDRPLMQTALEKNLEQTVDTQVNLSPSKNFTPAERKKLTVCSEEMTGLLLQTTKIWMMHENIRRGQLRPTPQQIDLLSEHRSVLNKIDNCMIEIAEVLRGSSSTS